MLNEKNNAGQVISCLERKKNENNNCSFRFKLAICMLIYKILFFCIAY
jgi:hypothetical protein